MEIKSKLKCKKNNIFLLSWKQSTISINAFSNFNEESDSDLIKKLENRNNLFFDFTLKQVIEKSNSILIKDNLDGMEDIWLDYLPNNHLWPLMSEKLKLLIEKEISPNDKIDWLECQVKCNDDSKTYYILRFNKLNNILDKEKTMFVEGTSLIIRPFFSDIKVKDLNIFTVPFEENLWKITSGIYVHERLKKIIEKEKITGFSFEKMI